jgi:AraC family transcriptional regulator of adaptative response / DNA-3-methyladenine glycosylase II
VERFGAVIQTPFAGVNRLFPTPHILASTSADALGALGITRQRQRAIQALAQVVDSGGLVLRPDVDISGTLEALLDLPGVGPWTAHYIAMRALRWPDAFPCGDVALHKALGVQNAKKPSQMAEQASERWRPWRSYAVIRAWNSL